MKLLHCQLQGLVSVAQQGLEQWLLARGSQTAHQKAEAAVWGVGGGSSLA